MEDNTELSSDPVFLYLSEKIDSGFEVLSGKIMVHKVAGPKDPRKTIEVQIQEKQSKRIGTLVYNYNKLLKETKNA